MKLGYRFNLVLIPVMAIALVTIAVLNTKTSLQQMNHEAQLKIQASNALLRKNLAAWMAQQEQLVTGLANSPFTREAVDHPLQREQLSAHLQQMTQTMGLRNIALLNR